MQLQSFLKVLHQTRDDFGRGTILPTERFQGPNKLLEHRCKGDKKHGIQQNGDEKANMEAEKY